MNRPLEWIRAFVRRTSPRERVLLGLVIGAMALLLVPLPKTTRSVVKSPATGPTRDQPAEQSPSVPDEALARNEDDRGQRGRQRKDQASHGDEQADPAETRLAWRAKPWPADPFRAQPSGVATFRLDGGNEVGLHFEGTICSGYPPAAIISGRHFVVGDSLGGVRIDSIVPGRVVLRSGDRAVVLDLSL